MTQTRNQSFTDWSARRKYPFTDGSDMTCDDGRRVPLSAFTVISLYPERDGGCRVASISDDGVSFAMGTEWTAFASFSDYMNGWMPVMRSGNCVGSVVMPEEDLGYVRGMASVKTLVFTEGHMDIRPELVRGFGDESFSLKAPPTFFGMEASGITYSFSSERYTWHSSGAIDMDVSVTFTTEVPPLLTITVNNTQYTLPDDGHILIRTPMWCETQFISGDGVITLHQRGA